MGGIRTEGKTVGRLPSALDNSVHLRLASQIVDYFAQS